MILKIHIFRIVINCSSTDYKQALAYILSRAAYTSHSK